MRDRDSINLDNARRVTAHLAKVGARTMPTLKDNLAARCGSKDRVEYGMQRARRLGWIDRAGNLWSCTDAGRASLTEAA